MLQFPKVEKVLSNFTLDTGTNSNIYKYYDI